MLLFVVEGWSCHRVGRRPVVDDVMTIISNMSKVRGGSDTDLRSAIPLYIPLSSSPRDESVWIGIHQVGRTYRNLVVTSRDHFAAEQ